MDGYHLIRLSILISKARIARMAWKTVIHLHIRIRSIMSPHNRRIVTQCVPFRCVINPRSSLIVESLEVIYLSDLHHFVRDCIFYYSIQCHLKCSAYTKRSKTSGYSRLQKAQNWGDNMFANAPSQSNISSNPISFQENMPTQLYWQRSASPMSSTAEFASQFFETLPPSLTDPLLSLKSRIKNQIILMKAQFANEQAKLSKLCHS